MTLNALLLTLVIGFGAILPLKKSRWLKAALVFFTAAVAFKFHISVYLGGIRFFSVPDLPGYFLQSTSFLFAAEMFFCSFLCVALLLRSIRRLFHGAWRTSYDGKIDLALLLLGCALAGIGVYCGAREPKVVSVPIAICDLPQEADNFRIALLSDIHADNRCSPQDIRKIVERTNALDADLVAIVGDFVDGAIGKQGDTLKELKNLHAPCGVYGVTGNHEYYSGYEWVDFLNRHGVTMLENTHVDLPVHLTLAGIPDLREMPDDAPVADLDRALDGAKYPVILLSHRPKIAFEAAEKNCVLQLSGHTHGGLFPGLRTLVGRSNAGFIAGLYEIGKMKLYVSSGTGIWGEFPVRLGTRPEITLIILKKQ